MERIKKCRSCGCKEVELFFDLGHQPFANALLQDDQMMGSDYPLSLSWCPDCTLVQLNHTADPKELFSQYVWVTSTSFTARSYAEIFCNTVLRKAGNIDKSSFVLEVASNDGTFLKPFLKRGYKVLGVDPAENICKIAVSQGVPTKSAFFGKKAAENILAEYGFPQILFARNVLPHVANLHGFVKGLRKCMQGGSLLVLEVHYAKTILAELHYDSIYHEHLCYFTLKSLQHLLTHYGIYVFDIMESLISGGSFVAFASLAQRTKGGTLLEIEKSEETEKTNNLNSWKMFADKSSLHRTCLLKILKHECDQGHKIVGYGASARSSTMLNFCGIGRKEIQAIADQNSMKQGLFAPGTAIPINSPEDVLSSKPDTVVILAWNFFDEIVQELHNRFDFQGNLVSPLPFPPKLLTMKEALDV